MAENEKTERNPQTTSPTPEGAIGDSSNPRTAATDPNGAQTVVGVPHPENRGTAPGAGAYPITLPELDDYDADKAEGDLPINMPPDQDDGRSYEGIADVGERAGVLDASPSVHTGRSDPADDIDLAGRASNTPDNVMEPTLDNQANQPKRFQRPTKQTT
jgi:hypothetical protein